MEKKYKIILIIIFILIVFLLIGYFSYDKLFEKNQTDSNNVTNHRNEFTLTNSNYLERNYQRYIAYKSLHSDYIDDQIITYVNAGLDYNDYENVTKTNINDGILMIVNKHNELAKEYQPKLSDVSGKFKIQLQPEAATNFEKMVNDAKKQNVDIYAIYSYINYEEQESLYKMYVENNGEKIADKHYAKAGYSDYQTGLSVAVNVATENFRYTLEYSWLQSNAYKYGFILRYPNQKEHITGFSFEPWHYRYVGIDAAQIIHDKNLTFEEYYATYVLK